MWGKWWGKSVIDKQKSLINKGFFCIFEVHKNGLINILNILDFRLHTFLDYIVFGLLFLNVIIFGLSKWHKGGSKPLSWYLLPPLISYFHLQTALLLKKRPWRPWLQSLCQRQIGLLFTTSLKTPFPGQTKLIPRCALPVYVYTYYSIL